MSDINAAGVRPVILCNGFDKKPWPVSFAHSSASFAQSSTQDSLFSITLKRVSDRTRYAAPIIVAHIEHIFFILADLKRMDINDAIIFLEPEARHNSAAVIISALSEHLEDMLHLILPADHIMEQEEDFHNAVSHAAAAAGMTNFVLFGTPAANADSHHSYIVPGQNVQDGPLCKVGVFTERADETFARVLISQGGLWDSGMTLYDPRLLCEEAAMLAPGQFIQCQKALDHAQHERKCILLRAEDYADMENRSLGTLLLEHTQHCLVLPCHSKWLRAQASEFIEPANRNTNLHDSIAVKDSYILSEGVFITAFGWESAS
ncbi:MAG TPA: sugar phosphate nucleotidyltransferase [Rickettsiales bacterium]|nr:sugar phosphate nucleotidyltransferase [Rickettsiales bacterium]